VTATTVTAIVVPGVIALTCLATMMVQLVSMPTVDLRDMRTLHDSPTFITVLAVKMINDTSVHFTMVVGFPFITGAMEILVTFSLAIMPRMCCMVHIFKSPFSAVVIAAISMTNLLIMMRVRLDALTRLATIVVHLVSMRTMDGNDMRTVVLHDFPTFITVLVLKTRNATSVHFAMVV